MGESAVRSPRIIKPWLEDVMSQAKILYYEHEKPPTNQGKPLELTVQPIKRFPIWLGLILQRALGSSRATFNKHNNNTCNYVALKVMLAH
eukprot:4793340-Ditylum_brightwellii.AAC.1